MPVQDVVGVIFKKNTQIQGVVGMVFKKNAQIQGVVGVVFKKDTQIQGVVGMVWKKSPEKRKRRAVLSPQEAFSQRSNSALPIRIPSMMREANRG